MAPTLTGLRVVEFGGSVAGAYCGKLLADAGAQVTVLGSAALTEHQRRFYGEHKTSVDTQHIDTFDLSAADVIIESSAPGPLVPLDLDVPQAIRVRISPFGTFGPKAAWHGTDIVDYAEGGHAHLYGDPNREPLRGPPDQPAVAAGLCGFIGAMAGLLSRDRLGRGQTVDISHVEVMVALHQVTLLRWLMTGDIFTRMGNRYTGQGQPNGPYRCADGWVSITCVTRQQVEGLLAITGLTHLLDLPGIESPMDFQSAPQLIDPPLLAWLSDKTVDDTVELFQAMRIPTSPVLDMAEVLNDPHLAERGFFRSLTGSHHVVPSAPFRLSHHQPASGGQWQPGSIHDGPLSGLKVLDLARVWAGPLCTRILADLGADVVWVEAPWSRGPKTIPESMLRATRYFPDDEAGDRQWNRNGHFVKYALGKRSLALDLQTTEGQETLAKLVPEAHVLVENFSTRVMPQLGFDEDILHRLNPDLIYTTMPGFGRSGPAENWLAYGSCVDSHIGLSSMIGYADQVPWKGGVAWPDPIGGLHAAGAILSSLWSGQHNGTGGLTIEAAQIEANVFAVGDRILEAQVDGPYRPDGNRQPGYLVQGIYPCTGHDRWIAISAPDETALQAVATVLDLPPLRGATDEMDKRIGAATARHDAGVLAGLLQDAGVPAGAVARAPDIMADDHLQERGAWVTVDQPDIGAFTAPLTPIHLSDAPVAVRNPAPTLGQHNRDVLAAAGLTASEISQLQAAGTVVTEPPR